VAKKINDSWTCPYCSQHQVLGESIMNQPFVTLKNVDPSRPLGVSITAIRCLNDECAKLYLDVSLCERHPIGGASLRGNELAFWRLLPASSAKPQPDYIPEPLREDYYEACLIRDPSPKSSATLARRCLQGAIRDFCGISKNRLIDEIQELRSRVGSGSAPKGVTPESVDAIDHVRSIGNIGAHMEKDVNLVVDIDPDEAQALIELVEMLFDEWYVVRKQREDRLARVAAIGAEKAEARSGAPSVNLDIQASPD
jgi:hypothetical protein